MAYKELLIFKKMYHVMFHLKGRINAYVCSLLNAKAVKTNFFLYPASSQLALIIVLNLLSQSEYKKSKVTKVPYISY